MKNVEVSVYYIFHDDVSPRFKFRVAVPFHHNLAHDQFLPSERCREKYNVTHHLVEKRYVHRETMHRLVEDSLADRRSECQVADCTVWRWLIVEYQDDQL